MSRSCPRVISPTPGRSILITSAPNQASSWVQVGPDWTCVKSRMRTPSSALPTAPHGFVLGLAAAALRVPPFALFAALRPAFGLSAITFFAAARALLLRVLPAFRRADLDAAF